MKVHLSILVILLTAILLSLSACATQATATATPTADPRALLRHKDEFFATSGECAFCHTQLKDESGADVSIDTAWRPSLMANSARDPYYRASVRHEVQQHPEHNATIQDKCATCHVPMAHTRATALKQPTTMLDDGFFNANHPDTASALDGVSCTLCHQIQAEALGEPQSFSGGFLIDLQTPSGQRNIFGPFPVEAGNATVMQSVSGYLPVQAEHIRQSELCATCHNLYTPYIEDNGQLSTKLFPEQTPQLEWLHSDYVNQSSCQSCHMPPAQGAVRLANTGGTPQAPFSQHTFIGANQFMLGVYAANAEALGITATDEQLQTARQRTQAQLEQNSATLQLNAAVQANTMKITVSVQPLTGHKFPTSFPSRRAWLHLTVRSADGQVVFESGAWNEQGAIAGNANDEDETRYEPHYTTITSPDQVQIYEAIIADPNGQVTTTLMRAHHYVKDNRLLPTGFDKLSAPADIAVYGEAVTDPDFDAGGDTLTYEIPLQGNGPYTVEAELCYQSIGYRWAEKLRNPANAEAQTFLSLLNGTPNQPARIARASLQIQP
ncbi:MAG: hypothetical protein KA988_00530 [Longilinea sp.]|nr:hypothetical protein [Longilinea sp.]